MAISAPGEALLQLRFIWPELQFKPEEVVLV